MRAKTFLITLRQVVNGMNYIFRPTFNVADSSMDLEASADLDDKTNLLVKLSQVRDWGGSNFNDRRVNMDRMPSNAHTPLLFCVPAGQ